jgi:hypothetical protein
LQIKQAAIGALIDRGVDFNVAVNMVKSASVAGMATRVARTAKVANGRAGQAIGGAYHDAAVAANSKIQSATGVDSWAGLGDKIKGKAVGGYESAKGGVQAAGARLADDARAFPAQAHAVGNPTAYGKTRMDAVRGVGHMLRHNTAVQAGIGGAALAGGGAYAATREKKAAFDALVDSGVDFDLAAALVSEKAQELYGA